MGHKPFLVFSDSLTRAGFAVLRLDDRGTGKSQGVFEQTSYDNKTEDALAAVTFLGTARRAFKIYRQPISAEEKRKRVHDRFGEGKEMEGQIRMMESPTFRDLLAFDPGPIFKKISCPVLALDGSLDTQVSAKRNLPTIAAMLAGSDSKDWQVTELPGLNHLFQTAKTGGIGEYSAIEETIAPIALRTVNKWLGERFLSQK